MAAVVLAVILLIVSFMLYKNTGMGFGLYAHAVSYNAYAHNYSTGISYIGVLASSSLTTPNPNMSVPTSCNNLDSFKFLNTQGFSSDSLICPLASYVDMSHVLLGKVSHSDKPHAPNNQCNEGSLHGSLELSYACIPYLPSQVKDDGNAAEGLAIETVAG